LATHQTFLKDKERSEAFVMRLGFSLEKATSPYIVTAANAATFWQDQGFTLSDGTLFAPVASAPGAMQYVPQIAARERQSRRGSGAANTCKSGSKNNLPGGNFGGNFASHVRD
jgi:hypothetical protein